MAFGTYQDIRPAFADAGTFDSDYEKQRESWRSANKALLAALIREHRQAAHSLLKDAGAKANADTPKPEKPKLKHKTVKTTPFKRLQAVNNQIDWTAIDAEEIQALVNAVAAADSVSKQIEKASDVYGVSRQDILGYSRKKTIVRARQAAMYGCIRDTNLSLPGIGKRFNRDHTTVIHACRVHAKRHGLPCVLSGRRSSQ